MEVSKKVLFNPFPAQDEWIKLAASGEYKFILVGGTVRSGKTYFILAFFIFMCRIFPDAKYIIVRKSLQRIKDTVLPTFYNLCPPMFLEQEPTQHNSWTAKFKNGSRIVFFAENIERDPDLKRFRGLEADGFGLEEMDVTYDGFMMALQRMGTWKMGERMAKRDAGEAIPPQIVLATSNPQQGWVKDHIYDPWEKGILKKSWLYIAANVLDNPYVSKEWLQDQKENLSPLVYKMMIEGDWNINLNENPWFYDFDEEKHVTDGLEIDKENVLYLSFDFNYSPSSVWVFQYDNIRGVRLFESLQAERGLRYLLEKLQWIKDEGYDLIITGDSNGHARSAQGGDSTCYQEIEEFFLQPVSEITRRANALHEHSRKICNNALYRVPMKFDRKGCKGGISEIKQAKPTDSGKLSKKPDLHLVDAFRYACNLLFRSVDDITRISNVIKANQQYNLEQIEQHIEKQVKLDKTNPVRIKLG